VLGREARVRDRNAMVIVFGTVTDHGGGGTQAKQYDSIVEQHFDRSSQDGDGTTDVSDAMCVQFSSFDGKLICQALSSICFEKQQEIELSSWSRILGVIVLMRIVPTLPFNSMYFFFVLDAPRVFRFVNSQYSIHDRFAAQSLKIGSVTIVAPLTLRPLSMCTFTWGWTAGC